MVFLIKFISIVNFFKNENKANIFIFIITCLPFLVLIIYKLLNPTFDIITYKEYYDNSYFVFEPGYNLVVYFFRNVLGLDFIIFQLLYMLFFLFVLRKYGNYLPLIIYFLFVTSSILFTLTSFNALRQGFSVLLILLAFKSNLKIHKLILLLISISFHYSAILIIPLIYFILNRQKKNLTFVLSGILLFFISISFFSEILPVFSYYKFYLYNSFLNPDSERFNPYYKLVYFGIYSLFILKYSNFNFERNVFLLFLFLVYFILGSDELVSRLLIVIYVINLIDFMYVYNQIKFKPIMFIYICFELFSLNSLNILSI